ncbi:MAG: alpha/beta hydrolase family esterase [Acidimicrobiales bacterium]
MSERRRRHRASGLLAVALACVACGPAEPEAGAGQPASTAQPASTVLPASIIPPSSEPPGSSSTDAPPASSPEGGPDQSAPSPPPADVAAPTSNPSAPAAAPTPRPTRPRSTTTDAPALRVERGAGELAGRPRTWTTVLPAGQLGEVELALLVVLHGVGGGGEGMRTLGFDALAAARGVMVVYPDGVGGGWNDGRPGLEPLVDGPAVDDVGFLRELVEHAVARGADPSRIAFVGFSNGAMMAGRFACERAELVRAVVLVGGAGAPELASTCRPARPVALLQMSALDDPVVPYAGGPVASHGGRSRGTVGPAAELIGFWSETNGCVDRVEAAAPGGVVSSARCAAAPVVQRRLTRGGHQWFAGPDLDATAAAWSFLISLEPPAL